MFAFLAVFAAQYALLIVLALFGWSGSRGWGVRHPKLWFGLCAAPMAISIWLLVTGFGQFQYAGELYRGTVHLDWLLAGPALLGAVATWGWFRLNRRLRATV